MKKMATLFLLLLISFHFVGYRFIEIGIEQNEKEKISELLDNHFYNDDELISFKIPLSLPYTTDKPIERYDGEISIAGKNYNYVEMGIKNGYIILKCLPNYNAAEINKKKLALFSILNDSEKNTSSKKSAAKKISSSDYTNAFVEIKNCSILHLECRTKENAIVRNVFYADGFHLCLEKPPQNNC